MPHEDQITALCFCNAERSDSPTLVTASKDGHFKVWILTDDSDIYSKLITSNLDVMDIFQLVEFCRILLNSNRFKRQHFTPFSLSVFINLLMTLVLIIVACTRYSKVDFGSP